MTLSCEDFTRFLFRAEGFVASLWFPLRLWLQRFQKWNRKRSLTTLTMAAAVTQCANRWTASQLTVSLETRASYQTVAKVEPDHSVYQLRHKQRPEETVSRTSLPAV